MDKKNLLQILIIIVIILSFVNIGFAQSEASASDKPNPNDPNTWNDKNINQLTPAQLANSPQTVIRYWYAVPDENKDELFKLRFDDFKDKADEYFSKKFGKPITGFRSTSGVTYQSGILKYGIAEFDGLNIPKDVIEIIALPDKKGFRYIFEKDKEVDILAGSLDKDYKLDDKTQLDLSKAQNVVIDKKGDERTIEGKIKGKYTLPNGQTVEFNSDKRFAYKLNGDFNGESATATIRKEDEVLKTVDGKFPKVGEAFLIESFDGRQSSFKNKKPETKIETIGYPILINSPGVNIRNIHPELVKYLNERVEALKSINPHAGFGIVGYRDKHLSTTGYVKVDHQGMQVIGESQGAISNIEDDKIFAYGKISIGDSGIKYKGLTDTSEFRRRFEGNNEFVKIDGQDEGAIAKFTRKIGVGNVESDGEKSGEITHLIYNSKGKLLPILETAKLSKVAAENNNPNQFLLIDRQLNLELDEKQGNIIIGTDASITYLPSIIYLPSSGNKVDSLSPTNVKFFFGNKLIDVNEEIRKLEDQIKTAEGPEKLELEKTKDSLEFLVAYHKMQGMLSTFNYDESIKQKFEFLKQHKNSPITPEVKISIAELYALTAVSIEKENPSLAKENYEKAISLYEEAKGHPDFNPQLFEGVTLSIARVSEQSGDFKKAERIYKYLIDIAEYKRMYVNQEYKSQKSRYELALAGLHFTNKNPGLALFFADESIKDDPENVIAKDFKRQLEFALLDTISFAISVENAQLAKKWEEKVRLDKPSSVPEKLFKLDKPIFNIGVGKSVMALFGHYDDLEALTTNAREKLNNQQKGLILIKPLHNQGYSLKKIGSFNSRELAGLFNLPIDSPNKELRDSAARTAGEIKVAIQDALNNPDVENLVEDSGELPFNFETGEGYVDKSFLESNWRDKILGKYNLKKFFKYATPIAIASSANLGTVGVASLASLGLVTIRDILDLPHLGIFDAQIELIREIGKKVKKRENTFVFSNDGEVLARTIADVETEEARNTILEGIKRTATEQGRKFEDLGDGVIRLDSDTYYVSLKGKELPTTKIDGKNAVWSAATNIDKIKELQEANLVEAKRVMNGDNLGMIKKWDLSWIFYKGPENRIEIKLSNGKTLGGEYLKKVKGSIQGSGETIVVPTKNVLGKDVRDNVDTIIKWTGEDISKEAKLLKELGEEGISPEVFYIGDNFLIARKIEGSNLVQLQIPQLSTATKNYVRKELNKIAGVLIEKGIEIQDFGGTNIMFDKVNKKFLLIDVGVHRIVKDKEKLRKVYESEIDALVEGSYTVDLETETYEQIIGAKT